jgi:hypothetical protein
VGGQGALNDSAARGPSAVARFAADFRGCIVSASVGAAMRIPFAVMISAPMVAAVVAIAALVQFFPVRAGPSVDAAGTCPSDEVLARLNPEIDGSVASQRRRTASPLRAGLPLYRHATLTGPAVEQAPSRVDDRLIVMVGAKLGASGPALVLRPSDNVCGWMDVSSLGKPAAPPPARGR